MTNIEYIDAKQKIETHFYQKNSVLYFLTILTASLFMIICLMIIFYLFLPNFSNFLKLDENICKMGLSIVILIAGLSILGYGLLLFKLIFIKSSWIGYDKKMLLRKLDNFFKRGKSIEDFWNENGEDILYPKKS